MEAKSVESKSAEAKSVLANPVLANPVTAHVIPFSGKKTYNNSFKLFQRQSVNTFITAPIPAPEDDDDNGSEIDLISNQMNRTLSFDEEMLTRIRNQQET